MRSASHRSDSRLTDPDNPDEKLLSGTRCVCTLCVLICCARVCMLHVCMHMRVCVRFVCFCFCVLLCALRLRVLSKSQAAFKARANTHEKHTITQNTHSFSAAYVAGALARLWSANTRLNAAGVVSLMNAKATKNMITDLPSAGVDRTPNKLLYVGA